MRAHKPLHHCITTPLIPSLVCVWVARTAQSRSTSVFQLECEKAKTKALEKEQLKARKSKGAEKQAKFELKEAGSWE